MENLTSNEIEKLAVQWIIEQYSHLEFESPEWWIAFDSFIKGYETAKTK